MDIYTNQHLTSWVEIPENHDFSIYNLPFGIFSTEKISERVGIALGDYIIDMVALYNLGYLRTVEVTQVDLQQPTLNLLMKRGKMGIRALRNEVAKIFSDANHPLAQSKDEQKDVLVPANSCTLHMPIQIGDYTDFYSSKEHATNVGTMFRDPDNALLPNWLHLPVGYHGRASSIILSDEPIRRPKGQQMPADADKPVFGASKLLDFELEMGFVTFDGKPLGESISTAEAEDYIFGMMLFNDWSARDIQKWEYVPLGPFLAKNFASSISPWIVTLDALEAFKVQGPKQEPDVLPYLTYEGEKSYDIALEAFIQPEGGTENKVCTTNFKYMYWTMAQQLAHHTVNGCKMRAGDVCASGTISGPTPDSYGSMLELSWRGTKPLKLNDGSERKFILDSDTVIMRGHCARNGKRIGFGEVRTKVLPAN